MALKVFMCCPCPFAGDHALGYDLANANLVNMDFEAHVNRDGAVPDVLLVRKSYEEKRRKTRGRGGRAWKLKHLPIEAGEDRCVWLG
jgi:nonsense-mediated mRNA decay protein 3